MGIKGVLIDVSGTLIDFSGKQPEYVDGTVELLEFLRTSGIVPILASNDYTLTSMAKIIEANEPLHGSIALTPDLIGKKKGSPLWIDKACELIGASPNELIYVGDSDYDMYTASHRGVVYFHAGWAKKHDKYGLNVETPATFRLILKHIFLKDRLWYWSVDQADSLGRQLRVRTLIDGNGASIPGLKSDLMSLKSGYDSQLGPITLRQFIILHLLASMYLEGLTTNVGVWCTYPRSSGEANPLLEPLLDVAAKLFRAKLRPDGIVRHTKVPSKHRLRLQGLHPGFPHEADSANLLPEPAFKKQVVGKRVVVFDDFTTEGRTAELSRNWFLNLGANEVIAVAIGKYGSGYDIQVPAPGTKWDSTVPQTGLKFNPIRISVTPDAAELSEFSQHYAAFLKDAQSP